MRNGMVDIVPMTAEQLDGVHKVETECFAVPWSRRAFEQELEKGFQTVYVTAIDVETRGIVGYGGMWHVVNEGYITNIAVHPDRRKQGIAQRILDYLVQAATEREMIGLTLEVRISNEAAQRLYTKNGFKPEGIRKNYYAEFNEDAVIMWKYLIPQEEEVNNDK